MVSPPARQSLWLRVALLVAGGLALVCLGGVAASGLSNLTLPRGPSTLDRLEAADLTRLSETIRLRRSLGNDIWPGFGDADVPLILWNHEYAFLFGIEQPPAGWQALTDDRWPGEPYYRQAAHDPQNFAVQVGDQYAASLATKWETDQFLIRMFRDQMPGPLQVVFPYRLLIQPSEVQMTGLIHESFHVYQVLLAPARLHAAETVHKLGDAYWAVEPTMRSGWQRETQLLADALTAASFDQARAAAASFLEQRAERRAAANLPADLVTYERELEWEEGLAKYVELAAWQAAANTPGYQPLTEMQADQDFKSYQTFGQRWSQEMTTLQFQANVAGETRLYYTGMAQGFLLDRLMPGWKSRALAGQPALEDLLREAIR